MIEVPLLHSPVAALSVLSVMADCCQRSLPPPNMRSSGLRANYAMENRNAYFLLHALTPFGLVNISIPHGALKKKQKKNNSSLKLAQTVCF